MLARALRWWRFNWRKPEPFQCPFCGGRTPVARRVLPYNAVIDVWNCALCMAGGYGLRNEWYGV